VADSRRALARFNARQREQRRARADQTRPLGPDLTSPPADDHDRSIIYQGSRPPMAAADWRALGYSETEATRLMKTCVPAATE